MKQKPQAYYNSIQQYRQAGPVNSYCAEMTFINKGTSTLVINQGLPLANNESISFDGKIDEMDITSYNIQFINDGTQTDLCILIKKSYNNVDYTV